MSGIVLNASWTVDGNRKEVQFSEGTHLIGAGSFAAINIGDTPGLCGFCRVTSQKAVLKCTASKPTLYVDNRKLSPGEEVILGDYSVAVVGRHTLHLELKTLSESTSPTKTERQHSSQILQSELTDQLIAQLNLEKIPLKELESSEVRGRVKIKLKKLIAESGIPESEAERVEEATFNEVTGLGPLETMLGDESISEIMVNHYQQIYIEKDGKLQLSPIGFSSPQALMNVIERIVAKIGRRIDHSSPVVDARLLDGSRVNAVIPPLAINGACLTIRKFSKTPITVDRLVKWGSMSTFMVKLLRATVAEHKNIIISGGTGSGKTTLLNALSSFIPNEERIVTVEDAAELQLQQDHVIRLESRPANLEGRGAVLIRDLVKNTLRMRPDRIVVGECRGSEALDMLQAMNTGHDGSMTTAHANSPVDMLRRLETMVLMAGMDLPLRAIREQIASALTIIVQQTRFKTGERRVTNISWIKDLDSESGQYRVADIATCDRNGNQKVFESVLSDFWQEEEFSLDLKEVMEGE